MGQDSVQDRNVVAKRLTRGRGCDDHNVTSGQRFLNRVGLVRVELLNAPFLEDFDNERIEAFRKACIPRILRGKMFDVRNALLQSAR